MNLQRRLLLVLAGVAVIAVLPTIAVFQWSLRQELIRRSEGDGVRIANTLSRSLSVIQAVPAAVEDKLAQQMAATATVLAHLVDLSEATGQSRSQLQQRLDRILDETVLDEFWISDSDGCARLRPRGNDVFCFSPDPKKQPQAHAFWPLLTGKAKIVIQEARKREIDNKIFQYVGVAGIDRPRIVQVGNHVNFLESLRQSLGLDRLIGEMLNDRDVLGIWVIDAQGKLIAGQGREGSGLLQQPPAAKLDLLRQSLSTQAVERLMIDQQLYVAVPLRNHDQTLQGAALVALSLDSLQAVSIEQTQWLAVVSIGILLVVVLLSYVAAGRLVQPIVELNRASQAIARGRWDHPLPTDRDDEIGVLATSFARMVTQLQVHLETLEQRVAERTHDLGVANKEILTLNQQLTDENRRMGAELSVVRRLHQMILPKEEDLLNTADLDIAAYMEPADEVGGDYYDVLHCDGRVEISIGDVTGHGLESGMVMLMVQAAVRTLQAAGETDRVKTINTLNRLVYDNTRRMRSYRNMTLSLLVYEAGRLRLSGQHEEAILVRADGTLDRVDTLDLGFPLGIEADVSHFIAEAEIYLHPGDLVVLYTDGVTEAANSHNQLYGADRLCQLLQVERDRSAKELCQLVVDDVYRHIGEAKIFDDITLIVIKRQVAKPEDAGSALPEDNLDWPNSCAVRYPAPGSVVDDDPTAASAIG
ncbi:MAG TPA: SpoIIE family protein phosphatase [Coleofasciculaceae cyanobacterium]